MNEPALLFFEFDRFRIDVRRRVLLKEGQPVVLTRKAFATLLVLVRNAGRTVEKQELLAELWPDSFVEESNISQYIYVLRRALATGHDKYEFIETIPKRGYKFTARVRVTHATEQSAAVMKTGALRCDAAPLEILGEASEARGPDRAEAGRARHGWRVMAAGSVLAFFTFTVAGLFVYQQNRGRDTVHAKSEALAVFPFRQVSREETDDLFGLAMTNALIVRLERNLSHPVLPTSTIMHYAHRAYDPVSAGRDLGAGKVLVGTIQRSGERLLVSVQLLDTGDGRMLWVEVFDERFIDVFALPDSVSARVTTIIDLPREQSRPHDRIPRHVLEYLCAGAHTGCIAPP